MIQPMIDFVTFGRTRCLTKFVPGRLFYFRPMTRNSLGTSSLKRLADEGFSKRKTLYIIVGAIEILYTIGTSWTYLEIES